MNNYFLKDKIINSILSREEFKGYTSAILSVILDIPYRDVYDNLKYEINRVNDNINYKNSITDKMYELDDNVINIEINYNLTQESQNKNMRYICHLLLNQVKPGIKYRYKTIHQININNYDLFGKNAFIYRSNLLEEKYHLKRSNLFEIYDINMEYLRKMSYSEISKMSPSSLEKLLYIFVCEDEDKRKRLYRGDVMLEEVSDELYHLSEVIEIGMKKGIVEGQKELIKKLVESGIAIEDIAKALKKPDEEIEEMINE